MNNDNRRVQFVGKAAAFVKHLPVGLAAVSVRGIKIIRFVSVMNHNVGRFYPFAEKSVRCLKTSRNSHQFQKHIVMRIDIINDACGKIRRLQAIGRKQFHSQLNHSSLHDLKRFTKRGPISHETSPSLHQIPAIRSARYASFSKYQSTVLTMPVSKFSSAFQPSSVVSLVASMA